MAPEDRTVDLQYIPTAGLRTGWAPAMTDWGAPKHKKGDGLAGGCHRFARCPRVPAIPDHVLRDPGLCHALTARSEPRMS